VSGVAVVSDYQDLRTRRTLEIVEHDYMPDEVTLRITGPHGGIHAVVTLSREAAANLGTELRERYGT